jgi:hypothetical protein
MVRRSEHDGGRFRCVLAIGVLGLLTSGCGLLYRSELAGPHWVLYADRDRAFLDSARAIVEEVYNAYRPVFELDAAALGTTRICFDGRADDVVDHRRRADLLGYYLPWCNVIRIDTESAAGRSHDSLRSVLCHEIAHHFFTRRYSAKASICWLNEGLASALESTLHEGARSEYPLFHPLLARVAHDALASGRSSTGIAELVGFGWSEFHDEASKIDHYALSWSLVYFVLTRSERLDSPLGTRIDSLVELEDGDLEQFEQPWREWVLGLDIPETLLALAEDRGGGAPLTAVWALDRLREEADDPSPRLIASLVEILETSSGAKSSAAGRAFLELAARHPRVTQESRVTVERGIALIVERLEQSSIDPAGLETLLEGLSSRTPRLVRWIEILVALLDARDGPTRATAARTLARIGSKPTITNPAFWHFAPTTAREAEVGEWRDWLDASRATRGPRHGS